MRLVCAVLAITGGITHADSSWSEYGESTRLRPASQLVETACDVDVSVRGAIALVELRQRLRNPGLEPLGATSELALPRGAELVALEVQHGTRKAQSAIAVRSTFSSDRVNDASVLGADPAMLLSIGDAERPRFRVIVQPLDTEQEALITTRWTRAADIRSGALHLTLPGRAGKPCRGVLHASPGPGTAIARVRFAGVEAAARTFTLADKDLPIAIELGFKRAEPVVWTQSESLGDRLTAQAITIVAPPAKRPVARRVLFVIDGSRSMEIVGRHRIKQLVHAIGGTLAAGTGIEAIVYDRTAQRIFGAWHPVDAQQLGAIETAITSRTPGNGSDVAAALALARQAIGDADGETLIVLVTDGVFGDIADAALADALAPAAPALAALQPASPGSAVAPRPAGPPPVVATAVPRLDLHAIVLTRGRLDVPDTEPLHAAIRRVGGSYAAIDIEQLDTALAALDDWLRPAWLDLQLTTSHGISHADRLLPDVLRAGSGVVVTTIEQRPRKPSLSARIGKPVKVASAAAPSAPIAELALGRVGPDQLDATVLARARARHPAANDDHAFVVVATTGKVASSRRKVAASGGPFTRMVAIPDPAFAPTAALGNAPVGGGSSIDRPALELMFRTQLQPAAFACYQRAVARKPSLAGTAKFRIELGRGETTRATVVGLEDATLDACLLDAAYRVTPALPNPDYNNDDRVIANYPLTFSIREQKPFVLPGDADSQSPLDIEAIKGGLPVVIKPGDTSTPLGDLEVPKSP